MGDSAASMSSKGGPAVGGSAPIPSAPPAFLAELPVRPAVKKARLPDNHRMLSRRLNLMRHRPPPNLTRANHHLAPKRRIDVNPRTSLPAILKRVQKLLDKSPRGVLVQKLPEPLLPPESNTGKKAGTGGNGRRSAAPPTSKQGGAGGQQQEPEISAYGERFDALVIGAGPRNIEKVLRVAAVFQNRGDCVVRLYTNTVSGIDTYEVDGSDDDEGEKDAEMADADADGSPTGGPQEEKGRVVKQRVRKASALEVGIRLV